MSIKLNKFFIFGFVISLCTSFVGAEEIKGRWKVGAHLGLAMPGGRVNDLQEPAALYQSSIEYFVHERISIGFEGGYARHRLAGDLELDVDLDGIKDFVQVNSGESFNYVQLTPFLKFGRSSDYGIDRVRWFRSYVIVAVGVYHTYNRSGTYVVEKGVGSSGMDLVDSRIQLKSRNNNFVGMNFGYGFGVEIWKHFRVGLDLRYHRIFDKPRDADYWVPSFRISRLF